MKVLSYYTDFYSDLGIVNSQRWKSYCDKHGFEFKCPVLEDQKHPYWKKMELWIDELNTTTHDYIIWTDIDVAVLNMNTSIYSIIESNLLTQNSPILISSDDQGLCCGFIIIKNCEWSKEFFKTCNFLRDVVYDKEKIYSPVRKLEDQSCIKYLYDGFENVQQNIVLLDQQIISHPRIGSSSATFAHHFWWTNNPHKTDLINYIKHLN